MKPVGISTVLVSTQHSDKVDGAELRAGVIAQVVNPVLAEAGFSVADGDVLVNPTGRFVIGGPQGDAGLTGRKSIVDTYGGIARHRRGSVTGKEPPQLDAPAGPALASCPGKLRSSR